MIAQHPSDKDITWQQCDLYSLPKLTEALTGCEVGIYLVHSMAPSSRLMQGSFEDTDLLLADNFIRAAESAGLKHVVYLSGLMPDTTEELSPHLRSRLEVEAVLRSRAVQVTVLRAGLIFGPGGSSFSMLVNLVRRLRVMLLPAWVNSVTHSIDITDVCRAFQLSLTEKDLAGGTYDLGGHTPMTYREMIHATAKGLGRPIWTLNVPVNLFRFSQHWVALFGSVPDALVAPLQESLRHDLQVSPNPLKSRLQDEAVTFEASLQRSVDPSGRPKPNPRRVTQKSDRQAIRHERRVRSVQRMMLPANWSAEQVAIEYGRWLTRSFRGLLNVERTDSGVLHFYALGKRLLLLELTPTPLTRDNQRRRAFYISGGILNRSVEPPGRFEFRAFPENGCLVASIHGFSPALPWWLYAKTQAVIHLWVMRAFGRHLETLSQAENRREHRTRQDV
ncbi:MAG: NAD(P)H-binding protein [Synoicihabitans sp.]